MIIDPTGNRQQQPSNQLVPTGVDTGALFGAATIVVEDDIVIAAADEPRWIAWGKAKQAWLDSKRSKSTVRAYTIAYDQFFEWAKDEVLGRDLMPWEANPLMAEEWVRYLRNEKGLAESTINLKLAALSSFYHYVKNRYTAPGPNGRTLSLWPADQANPFSTVERSKIIPYSRSKYPSVPELKAILAEINTDCLRGKRDFSLLYAFSVTCRRATELLNLKWSDIEHTPNEDGDRYYSFKVLKKGQRHRDDEEDVMERAVLDRNVYHAILEYLRADGRLDPSEGHYPADDDYIWVAINPNKIRRIWNKTNPDGEIDPNSPITVSTANGILKKYARRAGVDEEKAHLHALRHAGARNRVKESKEKRGKVDPLELMTLLQHSSLAVTQIYIQEVLEDPEDPTGRDAAEALLPKKHPRRRKKEPTPVEQKELL